MADFTVVLAAVLLLGAAVGFLFALYKRGPSADTAEDTLAVKSHRRDKIVELATELEDRNHYIAQLRLYITSTSPMDGSLLVEMPDTPEWLVEDERI